MTIKKYCTTLSLLSVLLFAAACNNQEIDLIEDIQPGQARLIPFTANVSSYIATRATLDASNNYMFQTTDKLYVWSDDKKVYGELSWAGADAENVAHGTTYAGSFSGSLTVEAGGTLDNETTLYAVIKSSSDAILGTFDAFKTRGFIPDYTLATTYAASNDEAVQKFSYLKATSSYGDKSFDFSDSQNTSFLSFDITLKDGTAAGASFNVTINSGGSAVRTGSVTTVIESGAIHAKFVAGFPTGTPGTTLSSATVQLGAGYEIAFGGTKSLEANKIYNVAKTYTGYTITASATIPPVSIPTIDYSGGYKTKTVTNIELSLYKTMAELLSVLDPSASLIASAVTKCEKISGDACISITGTGTPTTYSFSATAPGTATYEVEILNGLYKIEDLAITVSQVPVVTP